MLKRLKIKVFPFLIAWCTLFAHSAIPHNHVSNDIHQCKYLLHTEPSCPAENHGSELPELTENKHDDGHVCHLSDLLYITPSPEIFIDHLGEKYECRPPSSYSETCFDRKELFVSSQVGESFFLRAPPLL